MPNKGLVVGRVFGPTGALVVNAQVQLRNVHGGQPLIFREPGKFPEGATDKRGRFALPFVWQGAEFASDVDVIWYSVIAYTERTLHGRPPMTHSETLLHGKAQMRAYLVRNVQSLFNQGPSSPFGGVPELLILLKI